MSTRILSMDNSDRERIRRAAEADMGNLVANFTKKHGQSYTCPFHKDGTERNAAL